MVATRMEDLLDKTRKQLLELARKLELTGVSKLKKSELAARLLAAIEAARGEGLPVEGPNGGGRAEPRAGASAPPARTESPVPSRKRQGEVGAAPSRGGGAAGGGAAGGGGAGAAGGPGRHPPGSDLGPQPSGSEITMEPGAVSKLDLGPAGRAEAPVEHIPWGYGRDRVTAAAIDPGKLFTYWEVTDQAIELARARVGAAPQDAWLNLRVYDTTGLIFDGTNANSYFDHRVDRSDRQWFFDIGKPTSTAHVEIGVKSVEGYFARIARSGRVDFPRAEPAPWSEPEWMTVVGGGQVVQGAPAPAGRPRRPEQAPPPSGNGVAPGANGFAAGGFTPIPLWLLRTATGREITREELERGGWERIEWHEVSGESWFELKGMLEWQAPLSIATWEAGPFTYPVEIRGPFREERQGQAFTFQVEGVTHVVSGPWEVVVHNLNVHGEATVVNRWQVYRSWVAEGSAQQVRGAPLPAWALRPGASELVTGASERRMLAASELRLAGASELWRLGASELRFRGASERLYAGAAVWAFRGASERLLQGASEWRIQGASEQLFRGASEWQAQGASERRLGGASERIGASERLRGGASEQLAGGASERRLGASEHRVAREPDPFPGASAGYPKLED